MNTPLAPTLIGDLVGRALHIGARPMTPDEADLVQVHVLDALGCCIGAGAGRTGRLLADVAADLGETGPARSFGLPAIRVSPRFAVLVDATLTHAEEFDALHTEAAVGPAGVVVLPALLAAASRGCSGEALLTAVAVGFDTMVEASRCYDGPLLYADAWWPSALFGALGTAAAISELLGDDADTRAAALAIAGAGLGGLLSEVDLLDGHYLLYGRAAQAGFDAAHFAHAGAGGDRAVLDAPAGAALRRDRRGAGDVVGIGHLAGCSLKPYPCTRLLHSAVDALREILAEGFAPPASIERIEVALPAAALRIVRAEERPTSLAAACVSAPVVLRAVLAGVVDDPSTYAVNGHGSELPPAEVSLTTAADLDDRYPEQWGAHVTAVFQDGRRVSRTVHDPLGHPRRPLERAAVADKFRRQVTRTLSTDAATSLAADVARLVELDDVVTLWSHLDPVVPHEARRPDAAPTRS